MLCLAHPEQWRSSLGSSTDGQTGSWPLQDRVERHDFCIPLGLHPWQGQPGQLLGTSALLTFLSGF